MSESTAEVKKETAKNVPEPKPAAAEVKTGGVAAQTVATSTTSPTASSTRTSGQPANGTLVSDLIDHLKVMQFPQGTDRICVVTKLPDSVRQKFGTLTWEFRASQGTGEEYCKRYFPGIPVEVQVMK